LRALVLGFRFTSIFKSPGKVNWPVLRFLMWRSMMIASSSNTEVTCFLVRSVFPTTSLIMADLVIGFFTAVTFRFGVTIFAFAFFAVFFAAMVTKKVLIAAQKPSLHTGHCIHSIFYQCQHFYSLFVKKNRFVTYFYIIFEKVFGEIISCGI